MNSQTDLPILRVLWMVLAGMIGLLLLLLLCTPMEAHRRNWQAAQRGVRELIGPDALFFKCNAAITVGLFLLNWVCASLGHWLGWPQVADFGKDCKFFDFLSVLGFFGLLRSKAEAQHNQKLGKVLFGPRTLMSNTVNNYGDNYGNLAAGQSVHQESTIDAITIIQRINSLIERVKANDQLDASRRREAVTQLHELATQAQVGAAAREEPNIKIALKLLPGLLSSANLLA